MSRQAISAHYLADEKASVRALLAQARLREDQTVRVTALASGLASHVRAHRRPAGGIDVFLREYALSSEEGVALMCLAEALLSIPDSATVDALIRDKIAPADWQSHIGHSDSWFVNASTLGLMLTGRLVRLDPGQTSDAGNFFGRLIARSGEPVIRQALLHAMRIMGCQFVLGRTIDEAIANAKTDAARNYRHSFDMLGEGARTAAQADAHLQAYGEAIRALAVQDNLNAPGISVKLSALHPRFEQAQQQRVMKELTPRLKELAALARAANIELTIDAEESDRLDLTLDIFAEVYADQGAWEGLGLAVQAYQKRAPYVLDWLAELARQGRRRIPVRLVKGAYWDSEIKRAQERGLTAYPVFTRKASTDLSYLACASRMIASADCFKMQFATHNAQTVASILVMTGVDRGAPSAPFEFQRLHGMGAPLHDQVMQAHETACRIYAPVGSHEDLLAYLVRRLLENGANSSFVNRLSDDSAPIEDIVRDPASVILGTGVIPNPGIALPEQLFGNERRNSSGLLLSDPAVLTPLLDNIKASLAAPHQAAPIVDGITRSGPVEEIYNPADLHRVIGQGTPSDALAVEQAAASAAASSVGWDAMGGMARAHILDCAADLYEEHHAELMGLCVREAGKTLPDALSEVREAVDFLRYYAARARAEFETPVRLPGPAGENNQLSLHGRGVFCCISPWNFPLAIFTGQVAAALAAGNSVVAKPAEQTSLIAACAIRLLHQGGVPVEVLHLLPGAGESVGAALVSDPRISGVAFTGSTGVARHINSRLAERAGPIVPLIAETGGQNVMIADSSALVEQLIDDVIRSAFNSAGQRCSALRILFIQEEAASRVLEMLAGAMAELRVGDPMRIDTDIGPLIDAEALRALNAHAARMDAQARLIAATPLPPDLANGYYFAPRAYEIDSLGLLAGEVFGPVLHVIRYQADQLDRVCDAVNALGYGLTLGIHSRIEARVRQICARVRVGNVYVNRNMIGAVVGSQPFGGEGLSGTGPKAGGPHYLHRFAAGRARSTDMTAAGGNATLLSLSDEDWAI
ncbi:MAG: bifunctional proline dehydrogenase/L-glutamate gamma-semialdehyde dehydrogenase PutA [Alphaproteobacteria bacterium]|nr:bifunctional proline dehydrogenase/L-glutamate gamma-semialdehyde dehydrogenase PutA [Alphaproteobacteria bacterium]